MVHAAILLKNDQPKEIKKLFQDATSTAYGYFNYHHEATGIDFTLTTHGNVAISTIEGQKKISHIVFYGQSSDFAGFLAIHGNSIKKGTPLFLLQPNADLNNAKTSSITANGFTATVVNSLDELYTAITPVQVPQLQPSAVTVVTSQPSAPAKTTGAGAGASMINLFGINNKDKKDAPTLIQRILTVLGITSTKPPVMGLSANKSEQEILDEVTAIVQKQSKFQAALERIKQALGINADKSTEETATAVETLVETNKKLEADLANSKQDNQELMVSMEAQRTAAGQAAEKLQLKITALDSEVERLKRSLNDNQAVKPNNNNYADRQQAFELINALKLNWETPEHLLFWQAQTFNGGMRINVGDRNYRVPNRIGNLILRLKAEQNLTRASVEIAVQTTRTNNGLSGWFGWMARSSVTKQFYSQACNIEITPTEASLQKNMEGAFTTWKSKKSHR